MSPVETVCVATDTLPPAEAPFVPPPPEENASVISVRMDSSLSIRSVLSKEESAKILLTTSMESVSDGRPEVVVEGPAPALDWCARMEVGGVWPPIKLSDDRRDEGCDPDGDPLEPPRPCPPMMPLRVLAKGDLRAGDET